MNVEWDLSKTALATLNGMEECAGVEKKSKVAPVHSGYGAISRRPRRQSFSLPISRREIIPAVVTLGQQEAPKLEGRVEKWAARCSRIRVTMTNGTTLEGSFKNGALHGKGIKTEANGKVTNGDFECGVPHGFAVVTLKGKIIEKGNYCRGVFIPTELSFPSGAVFTGSLFDDLEPEDEKGINGCGEMSLEDGTTFFGTIKNGVLEGSGEIFYSTGKRICGHFEGGVLNGQGTIQSNELMQNGEFRNGILIRGETILRDGRFFDRLSEIEGELSSLDPIPFSDNRVENIGRQDGVIIGEGGGGCSESKAFHDVAAKIIPPSSNVLTKEASPQNSPQRPTDRGKFWFLFKCLIK